MRTEKHNVDYNRIILINPLMRARKNTLIPQAKLVVFFLDNELS